MRGLFSSARRKVAGTALALLLAVSPVVVISTSMMTGCNGKICFPNPCQCNGLFGFGLLAIWLLQGGLPGGDGISCWDLNGNQACDLATEDANSDGVCDALDCQGPPGEPGQAIPGIDGVSCWDLNASGECDLATEDLNLDGVCDALDCQGPAGPPGADGSDGSDGPPGPAGGTLFDLFIEDFFAIEGGAVSSEVSGQAEVVILQEPILSYQPNAQGPIGFRVSVPEIYTPGDPVTLRIFLWRDHVEGFCTTLRLDTFRMPPGGGIARYGTPLWLRLEPDGMTDPGMLVVDLPLNTPAPNGLGFANNLLARQMLAFELRVFTSSVATAGGMDIDSEYTVLGAEVFESASPADTTISGTTVFTSDADVLTFCAVETAN
jgi:hypothetical protein